MAVLSTIRVFACIEQTIARYTKYSLENIYYCSSHFYVYVVGGFFSLRPFVAAIENCERKIGIGRHELETPLQTTAQAYNNK